jgi:hypothetical protein
MLLLWGPLLPGASSRPISILQPCHPLVRFFFVGIVRVNFWGSQPGPQKLCSEDPKYPAHIKIRPCLVLYCGPVAVPCGSSLIFQSHSTVLSALSLMCPERQARVQGAPGRPRWVPAPSLWTAAGAVDLLTSTGEPTWLLWGV